MKQTRGGTRYQHERNRDEHESRTAYTNLTRIFGMGMVLMMGGMTAVCIGGALIATMTTVVGVPVAITIAALCGLSVLVRHRKLMGHGH